MSSVQKQTTTTRKVTQQSTETTGVTQSATMTSHQTNSVQIVKRGLFFDDAFFEDTRNDFRNAISNVVSRFGDKSSATDELTQYRSLRSRDMRDENQAIMSSQDDSKHKIVVDVQDFVNGGEINVKVVEEREVVVEGKVQKVEGNRTSSKSFQRSFILPEDVDVDTLSSVMSADGVLTITAVRRTVTQQITQAPVSIQKITKTTTTTSGVQETPAPIQDTDQTVSVQKVTKITQQTTSSTDATTPQSPEKSLPIAKKGDFFQDSFFENTRQQYQTAVKEVLQKMNIQTSNTDELSTYRNLRQRELREETQAATVDEDQSLHKVVVDVQDFVNGGEVNVKVVNEREIVIEGHIEKKEGNTTSMKRFCKRYILPEDIEVEKVTSVMSADGVLTITTPKKPSTLQITQAPVSVQKIENKQVTTTTTSTTGVQETPVPVQPAQPIQPAQPTQDTDQTINIQKVTQITQQTTSSTDTSAQPTQPAQPVQPVQPAQPAQPAQPVQPVQDTDQTISVKKVTITQQTTSTTDTTDQQPQPIQPAQPAQPVQPAQPTQPAQDTDQTISVQKVTKITQQTTSSTDTTTPQSPEKSLPIAKKGDFFQDSFFENTRQQFQTAVKEVLQKMNIQTSTTDELSTYRNLRQRELREETQAATVDEDQSLHKIVVDVQDFVNGGEVVVKIVNEQEIIIEGHIEKMEGNKTSMKRFRKRYILPEYIEVEKVTSVMSSDGILTITTPKKVTTQQLTTQVNVQKIENKQQQAITQTTKQTTDNSSTTDVSVRILQIIKKGNFNSDSFFEDIRQSFQTAVIEVLKKLNIETSSIDIMTTYRTVRQRELKEETQAITEKETDQVRKFVVDVQEFANGGEVTVKVVKEREVVVEGRVDRPEGGVTTTKTFKKTFILSENIEVKTVTAVMSADGILTITAPKKVTQQQPAPVEKPAAVQQAKPGEDRVLPVNKKGDFFSDPYFKDSIQDFQTSLKEVVTKFGEKDSKEDHMTIYRKIRQKSIKLENQVVNVKEDAQFQKIVLDVKDFVNGEVKVMITSENILVVEGKGTRQVGVQTSSHSFLRRFIVPDNVVPESIEATLSSDGILTIYSKKQ